MPEYLAPGVYVEETSFRSKAIEGVSTTTTAFIGPTRYGPWNLDPDIVTSLGEFARTYGDGQKLSFAPEGGGQNLEQDNYMWHAARAFFTEGGKRLYVCRAFRPLAAGTETLNQDGHGAKTFGGITVRARYPGAYGNFTLRFKVRIGPNVLGGITNRTTHVLEPTLAEGALSPGDVVWIRQSSSPASGSDVYVVDADPSEPAFKLKFSAAAGHAIASPLTDVRHISDLHPNPIPKLGDAIRVVTISLEVLSPMGESLGVWPDFPVDPKHATGGLPDSMFARFSEDDDARLLPIVATPSATLTPLGVLDALFGGATHTTDAFDNEAEMEKGVIREHLLTGGNDGIRPGLTEYEGKDEPDDPHRTGLKQFEAIDDISIVAAPGITANYALFRDDANAVIGKLLNHAEQMRYRIAVVDSAQGQTIADVRKMRSKIASKWGALYFPWVKVMDPITRRVITLPPSGFVAGIYARNDVNRAVYKAPANEIVNLALGFEMLLSKSQQEVLNPEGVNCFRFFEGRGMLVWGARTISPDPEWKYVNLRRYFAYLEHSIDRGTQWAVFEPNGERLWANIRRSVEDFLLNEWQMGALLGDKPEKAYFVKCDRTTMTQNDIDNGRMVCLVGVAALTPAEFVIFRVGQWTADHKV
jgi:Bacteriophage tail sheath protein